MNPVFLDTVGLLAIWNSSDQWHAVATKAFQRIIADNRPTITTSFVLLECGNAAARTAFRVEVARLREQLETDELLVVPSAADWLQAWADYERGKSGEAGIVDHVSFHVMRRLSITQAFTNDQHFRAAGFETLF